LYIHSRCAAVLKQYYSTLPTKGGISFDEVCECVISGRPLVSSSRDTTIFLSQNFLGLFSSVSLDKLFKLSPELFKRVCLFLDPFPELVALTYAVLVVNRYRKRRGPHWTGTDILTPGMTLHLTFTDFDGRHYLTGFSPKPLANSTRVVHVQDDLIIRRDNFAVLGLVSAHDLVGKPSAQGCSIFYHRISLKQDARIRGFSDVGANEPTVDLS
jgi:hypothetical protein